MDTLEFYNSLSREQREFYDKLIRHKENEFIQKSIELTLARHRLRAMNNVPRTIVLNSIAIIRK